MTKLFFVIFLLLIQTTLFSSTPEYLNGLTLKEWDVLETDIEKRDRSLFYPIAYTLILDGLTVGAAFMFYSAEELNWDKMKWSNLRDNLTLKTYRWDNDRTFFNYIGHPIVGSESYLRMRMRGFTPFESFLFSFAASTVWEFAFEGWVENLSVQDMIITPIAGSFFGEARFHGKLWLKKQNNLAADIGGVAIDPIQSLVEGVYSIFSTSNDPRDKEAFASQFHFYFFYDYGNVRFAI